MKRIKNKRDKQRKNILTQITLDLLSNLDRIAKGLTPPKIVAAQIDYYFTCNPIEQSILMRIFKGRENQVSMQLVNYFEDKRR